MAIALTIDLGTTNVKVGLVNESGEILNLRSVAVPVINSTSGGAEHNPEELKKLIIGLCKDMFSEGLADQVSYIVSSTYQFGLMLLDEQKKPVTGLTLLTDIRSQRTFDAFLDSYSNVDLYAQTGCPLMSPYLLARLFYFSTKEKEVFEQARYFTDSKAFLFEWLTGEFVTDVSTAAATQIYNIHQEAWDDSLLEHIGLSANQFPEIKDGTTYLSPLKESLRQELGLKQGVKVLLGVYDGAALGVGLGCLKPGIGIINVGTSAMLRVPDNTPAFDKSDNKRIQPYALNKSLFLNGGALNNAALPVNWLRNSLFNVDIQDPAMLDIGNEAPLLCFPYLTSERDSKTGPYASGVFFGLRQYHTKVDMARSVLEGVAYSMRYLYDALTENNLQITELRMGGGGAQIKPWPQIFANVLGLPINIPSEDQIALIGSAMLAFVADGRYQDVATLGEQIVKSTISIYPDENAVAVHNERYQFFKKVRETLAPLYKEHSLLSN
ncbi:Carbohydrate kinase, FGGY [Pseudopedobacter saltans DSM 12145]|uniref:Carbohydrate kinase, FGGY n=1 Tax=Pseudopedobacter saltans (strain ATCC 51119 / DSM 12145 / JCM 21818 / CCUG 39354 / LMG 10337 / NBRC 100064 / NCIMB 13643) TaxID=762903 RepID=F0S7V9_PSESL|nr:gluconokinase [Pseudopedobacter saltans]ADY53364.1 Carbohydrate kinase, FGGY [Pseudopedobacter saltans DSM 12145]